MPDILMVESDHDMRNPADFLILNKVAKAIFRVKGFLACRALPGPRERRSVTRRYRLCSACRMPAMSQTMKFQKRRMDDLLKQADDMAKMIKIMREQYALMLQMNDIDSSTRSNRRMR